MTAPEPVPPADSISSLATGVDGTKTASLIGAIRAGNDYARSQLSALYLAAVEAAVRRLVRGELRPSIRQRLEAERDGMPTQILMDTLDAIEKNRFEYRGPGSLSAWLNTCARHHVLDRARYWQRRADLPQGTGADLYEPRADVPSSRPGPRTDLERREILEQALAALSDLPEEDQIIIELHFFHGLPYSGVAEVFAIMTGVKLSEDAARMRCNKALDVLGGRLRSLRP